MNSSRTRVLDSEIEKKHQKWSDILDEKRKLFDEGPLHVHEQPRRGTSQTLVMGGLKGKLRKEYEQKRRLNLEGAQFSSSTPALERMPSVEVPKISRPSFVEAKERPQTSPSPNYEDRVPNLPKLLHGSGGPSKEWLRSIKKERVATFASPFKKEDWELGPERKISFDIEDDTSIHSDSENSSQLHSIPFPEYNMPDVDTHSKKFFELYHQMARQTNIVLCPADLHYFHDIADLEFEENSVESLSNSVRGSLTSLDIADESFHFDPSMVMKQQKALKNLEFAARGSSSPRHTYVRRLVTDRSLPPLASVLGQGGDIIDLSHRSLGDKYIELLAEIFDKLPAIRELNLCDNRLTDISLRQIMATVTGKDGCRFLEILNLSQNKIDNDCIVIFMDYLRDKECPLKELILSNADLDDAEMSMFMSAFEDNRSITKLDLSHNFVGGSSEKMKVLKKLGGTTKSVMLNGGSSIAEALRINSTLTHLDLSWNQMGTRSAEALGSELLLNSTLKWLNLAYNSLGDLGGQALGDMLQENTGLEYLDLSSNMIGSYGAAVIARGLQNNFSLRHLKLDGNSIGRSGGRSLMRAIQRMKQTERTVSIKGCAFSGSSSESSGLVSIMPSEKTSKQRIIKVPFDPLYPMGSYSLNMEDKYHRYVATELLQLASLQPGCSYEKLEYWDGISSAKGGKPGKTFVPVRLQRPQHKWSMEPVTGTPTSAHAYKRWFFQEAQRFSKLTSEQAQKELLGFRMTVEGSGEVYEVPTRGCLQIDFSWVPDLPAPHNVLSACATEFLTKMMLGYNGSDRLEFLGIFCKDLYVTSSQVQEMLDAITSSKTPFNTMQTVEFFARMLPQVLDTENLEHLLDSNLDDQQRMALQHQMGPVFPIVCNMPCGKYSLDLTKETHRLAALRIAQLNKWETLFMKYMSGWDQDHGGTSENGNWMNFRNALYKGQKGRLTDRFFSRVLPTSQTEPLGLLEFDYVSTTRAPSEGVVNMLLNHQFELLLEGFGFNSPGHSQENIQALDDGDLQEWASFTFYIQQDSAKKARYAAYKRLHSSPETHNFAMRASSSMNHVPVQTSGEACNTLSNALGDLAIDVEVFGTDNMAALRTLLERKQVALVQVTPPLLLQHFLGICIKHWKTGTVLAKKMTNQQVQTFHFIPALLSGVKPIAVLQVSVRSFIIEEFKAFVKDSTEMKIMKRGTIIQDRFRFEWLQSNLQTDSLNCKTVIHYADVYLKDLPQGNFWNKGLETAYECTWIHRDDAEKPKCPDNALQSFFHIQFRIGFRWVTCRMGVELIKRLMVMHPDSPRFYEDVIVMLFSRVVDLENFYLLQDILDRQGALNIAKRLGWLNILNTQHFDRHYDLDLSLKDHWKVANMITALSVAEDGQNLPEREFSRKMVPHLFIPGWDLPKSWDEEHYEAVGNIKPGVPTEGHFVCRYWSNPNREKTAYAFAKIQLREELAKKYTLLGIPLEV